MHYVANLSASSSLVPTLPYRELQRAFLFLHYIACSENRTIIVHTCLPMHLNNEILPGFAATGYLPFSFSFQDIISPRVIECT